MTRIDSAINAHHPTMVVALFTWGFGAAFYLIGFFHRVAPAVITEELMRDFGINAGALGNLSAFYFYSYVAMQIPTGILADRLGPRRLLCFGALVASAGAVIFSIAPDITWAATGRLLIGGSVAVAFVGLLKLATNWFAPNRFALISGLALFCGVIGAVFAGTPLRFFVDAFGWRNVVFASAAATLLISVGTWVVVRDHPHEKGYKNFLNSSPDGETEKRVGIVKDLLEVLRYPNTLLLFLIPGGVVGCVLTFSGLWGVPFLTAVHGVSQMEAATLTSVLLVAWAIGGPFFGWVSDRINNRKRLYITGCGMTVAGWLLIIFVQNLDLKWLILVFILTGFTSGCMIISFAFAKESVPVRLAGTVSGVVNMGVMSGPMVLQPAVGWVLDRMWTGEMQMGVRIYDFLAYRSGFGLMLGWIVVSFILLFFTRETGCQQRP